MDHENEQSLHKFFNKEEQVQTKGVENPNQIIKRGVILESYYCISNGGFVTEQTFYAENT